MRLYPEKPEHETRTDGEWVYGVSKQTVAYVPAATGRITLPEIRVDWWDTAAQQQRSAVIPAWEVNVQAGAGEPLDALPATLDETGPPDVPELAEEATDEPGGMPAYMVRAVLAVFAALLIILAGLAWRRRAGRTGSGATAVPSPSVKQQLAASTGALEKACQHNDPQAAARALLQWAEARWPDEPPRNLGALARHLAKGKEEIRDLERALYSVDADGWQGSALWKAFANGFDVISGEKQVTEEGLSPLYPY